MRQSNYKKESYFRGTYEKIPNIIKKSKISLRYLHTASFMDRLAKMYREQILKQLQFKISKRGRFKNRDILTKIIRDECIKVTGNVLFQLIKCRVCDKLSKADLHISRTCRSCSNLNKGIKDYKWGAWSNDI